ncbi:hypothetical protein TcCL_ESM03798 [Trypanosoma cruzi]|nr:hypothetical protein TcCL_ESM03798 [Trypanosoma cruzi]
MFLMTSVVAEDMLRRWASSSIHLFVLFLHLVRFAVSLMASRMEGFIGAFKPSCEDARPRKASMHGGIFGIIFASFGMKSLNGDGVRFSYFCGDTRAFHFATRTTLVRVPLAFLI